MRSASLHAALVAALAGAAFLGPAGPSLARGAAVAFGAGAIRFAAPVRTGGFRTGRPAALSFQSSRNRLGSIGFGPGLPPGFGTARVGPGRGAFGFGRRGLGFGDGGFAAGFGRGGRIGRAGIAPSPVLPPAIYVVGRGAPAASRPATLGPGTSGPLLLVIGRN